VGDPPGDGDARFVGRVRRVVAVCAVAALTVLSGCTLHGAVAAHHDPQPTGPQVDPMERTVSGSGADTLVVRPGPPIPPSPPIPPTTTTTVPAFN
jgi:hypothetical protein